MFKYTLDNKRYYTLNYYYKTKYNSKVFKVSLNANFGCPNKKNGRAIKNIDITINLKFTTSLLIKKEATK